MSRRRIALRACCGPITEVRISTTATDGWARFGVIGLNHEHIYGMVRMLQTAGAELVSFYAPEPELAAPFAKR